MRKTIVKEPKVSLCRECKGSGVREGKSCPQCKGSGRVWVSLRGVLTIEAFIV